MSADHETPLCSKGAAKLLSMSHRTLDQWRWKDIGPPYHKVNRQVRYYPSDLRAFMQRNRRDPGSMGSMAA
ncbi:MAG: helix-turn-helix domain-containing protein [Alphaproteobacteria bacterium]|nr:helix-turn-helix domain-containing protein [Alphaproteobacteria bacterium]MBU4136434.1 helix-turn-helix domain-containing protein [Alphaproteobacteria bacterium]